MPRCRWCGKHRTFGTLNTQGICPKCSPEVIAEARVLRDEFARHWRRFESGPAFRTRLHALERHTAVWRELEERFEARGIDNHSPPPSEMVRRDGDWREQLIEEELLAVGERALAVAPPTSPAVERLTAWRTAAKAVSALRGELAALHVEEPPFVAEALLAARRYLEDAEIAVHFEAAEKAEFIGDTAQSAAKCREALYVAQQSSLSPEDKAAFVDEAMRRLAELE